MHLAGVCWGMRQNNDLERALESVQRNAFQAGSTAFGFCSFASSA